MGAGVPGHALFVCRKVRRGVRGLFEVGKKANDVSEDSVRARKADEAVGAGVLVKTHRSVGGLGVRKPVRTCRGDDRRPMESFGRAVDRLV